MSTSTKMQTLSSFAIIARASLEFPSSRLCDGTQIGTQDRSFRGELDVNVRPVLQQEPGVVADDPRPFWDLMLLRRRRIVEKSFEPTQERFAKLLGKLFFNTAGRPELGEAVRKDRLSLDSGCIQMSK
eukprot:TRINITY_DN13240_c0_g1_i1.p1 TRINITY_DN13240_c0_g1~~TRINITY_DN13240_c0_g1_i1.p1  ORF type:complete len:128 (+),score=10.64 TRINITY_DN13240_c0_g1_i1:73-456(+)